jgi:hypothetical protein
VSENIEAAKPLPPPGSFQGYSFVATDFSIATGVAPELIDLTTLGKHRLLGPSAGKLDWAGRHLAALEHNINQAFLDPTDRAVIRADFDAKSGYHVFRVSALPDVREIAENFTHVVGDIAKNLHPALDQLAWQLACDFSSTGTPPDPKGIFFPITDTPDLWKGAGRSRKQIKPDHWDFIERFQPYHGVDGRADSWAGDYVHPLAFLRDLSNDDKHRIDRPVLLVPGQLDFVEFEIMKKPGDVQSPTYMSYVLASAPQRPGVNDWDVNGIGKPLELGLEVMRARLTDTAQPEINPAGFAVPQVAFGDNRAALPALQRARGFAHLVLSEFYRQFPPP